MNDFNEEYKNGFAHLGSAIDKAIQAVSMFNKVLEEFNFNESEAGYCKECGFGPTKIRNGICASCAGGAWYSEDENHEIQEKRS